MEAEKIQVKLFVKPGIDFDLETSVPTFHDFIRRSVLPELMIDVAPYDHVPEGPGILFVGHGSDYYLDEGKGRLGLLYSRKRMAPAPESRLKDSMRRCLFMAKLLQEDPYLQPPLRFSTSEALIRLNDRLRAPNTDATWETVKPKLEALFSELYEGAAFTLTPNTDAPRELLSVSFSLTESDKAPDVDTLLGRLGGAPTGPS